MIISSLTCKATGRTVLWKVTLRKLMDFRYFDGKQASGWKALRLLLELLGEGLRHTFWCRRTCQDAGGRSTDSKAHPTSVG